MSLASQHLIEPLGIKPDHDFVPNDDRRRRTALIFAYQLADILTVRSDVLVFENDSSLREVRLGPGAGRSAGLAVYYDLLLCHQQTS